MQIAAIIGFVFACFAGGYVADAITARVIIRQGRVFPEQRLVSLIPGFVIAPVGCILIAFACSRQLSWVAIAFGFGMGKQTPTSSHKPAQGESLPSINEIWCN